GLLGLRENGCRAGNPGQEDGEQTEEVAPHGAFPVRLLLDWSGGLAAFLWWLGGAPRPQAARPGCLLLAGVFLRGGAGLPAKATVQAELQQQPQHGGSAAGPVEQDRLVARQGDRVELAERIEQPQSGIGG